MFYITLPNFEIDVHQALRPHLKTVPLCIEHDKKIYSLNAIAKERGLTKNMSIAQAKMKVPELCVERPRYAHYREFSKRFYTLLSSFSKTVEPVSQFQAFFENDSSLQFYTKEEYGEKMCQTVEHDLELTVRIGSGHNKTIAQLAADVSSTTGNLHVDEHSAQAFMNYLPISMLPGIGRRTAALLYGMGITTIGAFANYPKEKIVSSFGNTGALLQRIAQGNGSRECRVPLEKKTITRSISLQAPSRRKEYVTAMFFYALSSLQKEMKRRSLGASVVLVSITFADGKTHQRQKRLNPSVSDSLSLHAQHLLNECVERIELPVVRIRIQCGSLEPRMNTSYFFDQLLKNIRDTFPNFSPAPLHARNDQRATASSPSSLLFREALQIA